MASKRRQRRKCLRKVQYASLVDAVRAAARLRNKLPGERWNAYKCHLCHRHHIGHTPANRVGTMTITKHSLTGGLT